MKDYEIIENLVPRSYANNLEFLTSSSKTSFGWYLQENISGGENSNANGANFNGFQYGFAHVLSDGNSIESEFYKDFFPLLYFLEDKTDIVIDEIIRVRCAMNTWTSSESIQHYPHTDYDFPHYVLLYYVNDSDGDTIFYDQVHEKGKPRPKEFTILDRVSPKKGAAVLFNGLRYHSSSKPQNNSKRIIVNINFR